MDQQTNNWFKHIEHDSKHSLDCKQVQKFNYENVELSSKCNRCKVNSLNCKVKYFDLTKCHSPVNLFRNFRNSNRTKRQITKMHLPPSLVGWILILICLIEHCDSKQLLPIDHHSSIHNPSRSDHNPSRSDHDPSRSDHNPSISDHNSFESNKNEYGKNFDKDYEQNLFVNRIQSSSLRIEKRSNSILETDDYVNDKKQTNDELSSETIVEMPTNQLTLNNYLDNSLIVNNLTELDLINQTIVTNSNKSTVIASNDNQSNSERADNQQTKRDDQLLKEEQERILKEIDRINQNQSQICSSLNKQHHFKTKDESSDNRDKKYWLLIKALEPKFVKMPFSIDQIKASPEIKSYYRELIDKLELITSILYDNNAEPINALHNLQLMRKIIREIAFNIHPHILRARLISLNSDKTDRKRRHSSFSINSNLDYLDQNEQFLEDDEQKLTSNKFINQNVPFRRRNRREDDEMNSLSKQNTNDQLTADSEQLNQHTDEWLRAKNILFYMRGENEPVHEFNDIHLTTKKEHVIWLDVREVEESSGTLTEFDQLLTKGHLFVMNEKERLFAGYTGIYFDCAMRRWLISYTSLLVSCNQCSGKKQTTTASVDNQLDMRLIGLLSVDIDLETVDVNQCEAPTKLEPQIDLNKQQTNQANDNYQPNYQQNSNQEKSYHQASNRFTNLLASRPTAQQLYQFDHNPVQNRFEINSINHFMNNKLVNFNDTFINQAQRLIGTESTTDTLISKTNQSSTDDELYKSTLNRIMLHFERTNKCHQATSQCEFTPNHGISKGSYVCKCRPGYYAVLHQFSGLDVERAWQAQNSQKQIVQEKATTYDNLYICKKCSEGCDTCIDSTPCLSSYNWVFRISLLVISILCICLIFVLTYYIYKYRKIKVFKVASPVFLSITLIGCAVMYAEMIAIFPVLNRGFCIMTKITRHLGFCITYSALLLKTWRVSLTFRVKSAHKLKLTDRQLLQWLFPILLVMTIFLGTWIISDPPKAIMIVDWNKLKFAICEYNWFDHSLAIGEFLFLLWGIKVCYNVRNAESFFNEAKYISWSIYNIAAVNILMILIHIILLPSAGPDVKYFLGFVRTQLSTSTTIGLIFGPKFYRLIKGEGNEWNARDRARRGINFSFSLNGVGVVHEELTDLYQENEELKEQVHKLATQVELMRLRQMQINNRHLKSKHNIVSGAASQAAVNSSVVVNTASTMANVTGLVGLANASTASPNYHSYSYNQLNPQVDSAGIGLVTSLVGGVVSGTGIVGSFSATQPTATCQRISPAAELQSEKV